MATSPELFPDLSDAQFGKANDVGHVAEAVLQSLIDE